MNLQIYWDIYVYISTQTAMSPIIVQKQTVFDINFEFLSFFADSSRSLANTSFVYK